MMIRFQSEFDLVIFVFTGGNCKCGVTLQQTPVEWLPFQQFIRATGVSVHSAAKQTRFVLIKKSVGKKLQPRSNLLPTHVCSSPHNCGEQWSWLPCLAAGGVQPVYLAAHCCSSFLFHYSLQYLKLIR